MRSTRSVCTTVAAVVAMALLCPAVGSSQPRPIAVDVKVEVTEEQRPEGYIYRYRVANKSSFAMGRLHLGHDFSDGSVEELRTVPLAVRAPEGWSGRFEGAEGLEGIAIVWSQNDPMKGAFEIPPAGTLEGFEVVLPRLSPEYRTAVFTAFLTDAVYHVGNVTPAVVSNDRGQPTVLITEPPGGATVSGSVTVSAQASDNVGVLDVQFKVDRRDRDARILGIGGGTNEIMNEVIAERLGL